MMCCKSFGVIFLLLSTASSQDFSNFGGLYNPFSSGESSQSSAASSAASTASGQSAGQNYGYSDTAFQDFASQSVPFASQSTPFASQSAPYGFQQDYRGEPGQFDNGFNNYGLQNQGSQYGFVNQAAGSSGFSQGYANQPEKEIINPPLGLPDITERSSPQGDLSSPYQLDNAPLNFPGFLPNYPPDSIASTPQTAGGSEFFPAASPVIAPGFSELSPEGFSEGIGYSPEFTPYSEEPSPVGEPLLPSPPSVDLPDVLPDVPFVPELPDVPIGDNWNNGIPDVPFEDSPLPLGNGVGGGDFPVSGFLNFPPTSNYPTLLDNNEDLSPGGYYDDGSYDDGYDNGYYDYGYYDYGYDNGYYDDEYYNDDGDYDDEDYDDYRDLADDSNFQPLNPPPQPINLPHQPISPPPQPINLPHQPINPPQLQPPQLNGNEFGGDVIAWPSAYQGNFFPGSFRCCSKRSCKKSSEDVEKRRGCGNSRCRCCCC